MPTNLFSKLAKCYHNFSSKSRQGKPQIPPTASSPSLQNEPTPSPSQNTSPLKNEPVSSSPETPSQRFITFKPILIPEDYPPIENEADSRIPLHWNLERKHLSQPQRLWNYAQGPYTESRDNRYANKLNELCEKHRTKKPFTQLSWSVYSPLPDSEMRKNAFEDQDAYPAFCAIELDEIETDRWKLLDAPFREIVKEEFGEDHPPILCMRKMKN